MDSEGKLEKSVGAAPTLQKTWIGSVCGYFRDFLDTDFKKTKAPKRSVSSRDSSGILTGVALSKYPDLYRDLWELLARPFGSNLVLELPVTRGKYRSRLSEKLLAVINKQIEMVGESAIEEIVNFVRHSARDSRKAIGDDPERFADEMLSQIRARLLLHTVNPLLANLDTFFKNQGDMGLETIFNLEEELGQILVGQYEEAMGIAVASAIVDDDFSQIDDLIAEICELETIRLKFVGYFESFSSNDFFNDLSELRSTLKLKDNFQLYVYACAMRFGKTSYPLFYFPVEVTLSNSVLTVRAAPHLLINKKAIDFAASEVAREIKHHIAFPLSDRIVYVAENQSLLQHAQRLLDELTSSLTMNGAIDLHENRVQKVSRSQVSIDNSLHFAAFDQSDESLLNDFEDLLEKLSTDDPVALDFDELISGFMSDEPISLETYVDQEWAKLDLPSRLVYESPVPLNEEQRKIISALNAKEGRFVAVEGPPGTGKSHTITACVFDAILRNKNVLVLSDKKEALDVVESKIRQTLSSVRVNENLQDPILRLGKQGSTYGKILSSRTIEELKRGQQVARANEGALPNEIGKREVQLKQRIGEIEDAVAAIDMRQIVQIQQDEKRFNFLSMDPDAALRQETFRSGVLAATVLIDFLSNNQMRSLIAKLGCDMNPSSLVQFLDIQEKITEAAKRVHITAQMRAFGKFERANIDMLGRLIDGYAAAKKPVIGYLFSKGEVLRLNRDLSTVFAHKSADNGHKIVDALRHANIDFREAINDLELCDLGEEKEMNAAFAQLLRSVFVSNDEIARYRLALAQLGEGIEGDKDGLFERLGLPSNDLSSLTNNSAPEIRLRLTELAQHIERFEIVANTFTAIPELDYAKELCNLEHLQTKRLADTLDKRVVEFANTKRNAAAQIKEIIKKKQKFPRELFEHLRDAFPVMIAGIRDYAEYVPLEKHLFDLIIIDEASQVSIAQALPAFIRANKVLVLGDKNQFSNVKTENASKAINQTYKAGIEAQFKRDVAPDIAMLNQIKMFDIKTSVLDFVERIANFKIMLRKHFRGYPELIGFSSKYFYQDGLQAVKIRGIPIDEVIEFFPVQQDGLRELQGNTNRLESDAIIEKLAELANKEEQSDVMVITPHKEQQRLILNTMLKRPDGQEITEKLKLRVFTFDTCQGEESHTVIYSMVATELRDRLSYIFAPSLAQSDSVDDNLRLQRLNVGFSRAKERIWIFHSKPVEEYKSAVQSALSYYARALDKGRAGPEIEDVDPSSPMELRVLHWLREVPVLEELEDRVEVDAQFELGTYLRQLDPTYSHPNYKVDFLVKVRAEREVVQIIIEYDGFKEHFNNISQVDANNYREYMKPEDVERQKILEGYGYKFLRINRFNIGEDPVKTLDERLRRLISNFDRAVPSLIDEHRKQQQAIADGHCRVCGKCGEVKSIADFYDKSLKSGKGGHGRNCMTCKKAGSVVSSENTNRIYLNCPYEDKEECKKLGGRWDPFRRKWYIPQGGDMKLFSRWLGLH